MKQCDGPMPWTWAPIEEEALAQLAQEFVNCLNVGKRLPKINAKMAMFLLILSLRQSRHPIINQQLVVGKDVASPQFLAELLGQLKKDHPVSYQILDRIFRTLARVAKRQHHDCTDEIAEVVGPALIRSNDKKHVAPYGLREKLVKSMITHFVAGFCFAPDDNAIYLQQTPTMEQW